MLNDHLAVGVRNAGKQIPYGSVSLLVNVLLPLRNGFRLARNRGKTGVRVIPQRCACLLYNGLPDVVTGAVEMKTEALGKVTVGRLDGQVSEPLALVTLVVDKP